MGALLSACGTSNHSALNPASGEADLIANLWWIMLAGASVIFIAVIGLLLMSIKRGRAEHPRSLDEKHSWRLVIAGGVVIPLMVLFCLVTGSVMVGQAVIAQTPANAMTVEVIGRLWWWEVHYLDENNRRIATTANEIHVPTNRPVRFLLKSDNVIHSFWAPNLQGKVDLIPGQINSVGFEAREAGTYKGQCAEFCGVQHAKMQFLVIAEPEEQFQAWLQRQREPAREPEDPLPRLGKEVFFKSSCIACHAIRGTLANRQFGPDLTHIGSRQTLASAAIPNTTGHLGGWIADPQHIKPGNLMPATPLEPEDLRALIFYLQSLK